MTPTRITLDDEKTLRIVWDDGHASLYPLRHLRRNCPCATCRAEAETHGEAYIPLFSRAALTPQRIEPLGFYAIQITWNDGHSTGIYSYELLQQLDPARQADPLA